MKIIIDLSGISLNVVQLEKKCPWTNISYVISHSSKTDSLLPTALILLLFMWNSLQENRVNVATEVSGLMLDALLELNWKYIFHFH